VRLDPEEGLAQGGEDGEVKDAVGMEKVELEPVVEEEPAHELVRRHPESTLEEGGVD